MLEPRSTDADSVIGSRLRKDVRAFLAEELSRRSFVPTCDSWVSGVDPAFSAGLGARGWIGMTFPVEYGGHGLTALDRFIVIEELLAAGAPVAAHWFADRQVGPSLLRYGTEAQKQRFLPAIARGECFFSIGMSEPDAGSDLASVRTRARRVTDGWAVSGTKVWTTGAQHAHALLVLLRTDSDDADRHRGLSQFLVTVPSDGLTIRPIRGLGGETHFNEVIFDEVFVPDEMVLGDLGAGWHQVTAELAFERSGPERVLSTYPLLATWGRHLEDTDRSDPCARRDLGRLVARLWTLRHCSWAVANGLAAGEIPDLTAALVKDLGTAFEGDVVETVRRHAGLDMAAPAGDPLPTMLNQAIRHAPGFTLRGGTSEILRGIVARHLVKMS